MIFVHKRELKAAESENATSLYHCADIVPVLLDTYIKKQTFLGVSEHFFATITRQKGSDKTRTAPRQKGWHDLNCTTKREAPEKSFHMNGGIRIPHSMTTNTTVPVLYTGTRMHSKYSIELYAY